jgi:hypothetical protein
MKRIAEKIIIYPEIYIDNIDGLDLEYQLYDILDKDNDLLETNRYYLGSEPITVENICKSTGIKFGVSTWVKN